MLSEPLRKELIMESKKIVIRDSPIFKNNFSESIIEKTVSVIQEVNFSPDQNIYLQSEMVNDIYFLERGQVEIFLNSQLNNKKISVL
jgi:CRP-like cAMP-binding protein